MAPVVQWLRALIMSTDARVRAPAEATFFRFLRFFCLSIILMHVTAGTISCLIIITFRVDL